MVQCIIFFGICFNSLSRCELARHFDRSFKKLSVKSPYGVLLLLALALCTMSFREKLKGDTSSLPFGHPIQHSGLSCEQVIKLVDWGSQKFGGIGSKDVFNPDRAAKIAQVFIEKLDPSRMLFTMQEIEALKQLTQNHWNDLLQNHSCEPWQNWLKDNYPKAQQRISYWIKTYKVSKGIQLKLSRNMEESSLDKTPEYTQFAGSLKDLEKRWNKELGGLLNESSLAILKAYQQNMTQLLWDRVEQRYFDVAPETHGLLAKAFLGGLDKYSTYFSPVEFEDFYEELKGTAAGLGLRLQKVPQGFMIEKIIEASAAQRARDLHEGDIIEKVDEITLASLPFEEAKQLLKGPENSKVRLVVTCSHKKQGSAKAELTEWVLERTQFELEETKINFSWKNPKQDGKVAKKVAVISVPAFYGRGGMGSSKEEKSVSEDFQQRITEELLKDTAHAGLVLDLRGNPGGYLEEAVSMGSFFVGDKPIVGVLEEGTTRILKEDNNFQPIYQKPLVVLVDQESASAAEVLSGALKDYQRAIIVGSSRTYGKGTVQKLFHLEDPLLFSSVSGALGTGVLKLTTSVFYSPLGHTPANGGVASDIALNEKDSKAMMTSTEEILPIVDLEVQSELEKAALKHQEEIHILSEKSRERINHQKDLQSNQELDEAIAIVSDLADLKTF